MNIRTIRYTYQNQPSTMNNYYSCLALLVGLGLSSLTTIAQNTLLTTNPHAQRDIQLVSEYVNALTVSGDQAKARLLIDPAYMAHGPGAADSANTEKTMTTWQTAYQFQTDRKNDFSAQSVRIPWGPMQGDWVLLWGYYGYSDKRGGKAYFPYHYTAKVAKGKIVSDRLYYDELSVLKGFGFKVIPPGGPTK